MNYRGRPWLSHKSIIKILPSRAPVVQGSSTEKWGMKNRGMDSVLQICGWAKSYSFIPVVLLWVFFRLLDKEMARYFTIKIPSNQFSIHMAVVQNHKWNQKKPARKTQKKPSICSSAHVASPRLSSTHTAEVWTHNSDYF